MFKCAGDYIAHCHQNDLPLPPLLHAIPLSPTVPSFKELYLGEGDEEGTLYPATELPKEYLQYTRNGNLRTSKPDETRCEYLYTNATFGGVMQHLDNHKNGHCRKHLPFLVAAIHPNSNSYHCFKQDNFLLTEGG